METDRLASPLPPPPAAEATSSDDRSAARSLGLAVMVGLAGGVLTAYAQGWLPASLSSMANSSTSWCLVALLVALSARRRPTAVIAAAICLWALNAGYVVGSLAQGNPSSSTTTAFWFVAGTVAGPVLGLAAHSLVHGRPPTAAVSVGVLVGVVVGEGAHGLAYLGDSTSRWYWGAQVGVGAVVLLVAARARLRSWAMSGVAVATAVGVGVVLVAVYRLDLLGSVA